MITSSYRPGAWFGVFGSATTLLLPGSEKARVAGLWSRIDDGAGFDEVLDALLETGLGALPGFVLVSGGEGPTKLLARGAVLVTGTAEGEDVRIDGRDALTWVERTLDAVESLSFVVGQDEHDDEQEATEDLPIVGGLVRVSRVDQPAASSPASPPAPVTTDPVAAETEALALAEESSPLDDESDTADVSDAGPLDEPVDPPESSWAPPPTPPPSAPPAGPPVLPPPPPSWQEDPLSAPLPADGSGEPEGSDHDGLTTIGGAEGRRDEFARDLPGIPGQPPAPSRVAPVAKLMISNGESIDVDRVILVGRAPEARRFTSTDQPRLVKVPSPLHEISSTHLEIRPGSGADHGSAVVTDMGSTNGTVLEQPGLGLESLKPGIAVQLIPGATINLGDGVSIQVTRP